MPTTRAYGELDRDLVDGAVQEIVARYLETPTDEGDRVRRPLEELTVAERVTVYSIFMRLAIITRPPELEDDVGRDYGTTMTGRRHDDNPPVQNIPGTPAAALERRFSRTRTGRAPRERSSVEDVNS